MKKHLYVLALLCLGFGLCSVAQAGSAESKIYLSRADSLLNQAQSMVGQAKSVSDSKADVQVHYEVIHKDIHKIRTGIQSVINQHRVNVNRILPVGGKYDGKDDQEARGVDHVQPIITK
jgi:RAQPRD family integrative conjugative element protein